MNSSKNLNFNEVYYCGLPIIVPVGVTLLTGGYGVKKLFETKIKGKVNNVNEFTKLKVNNAKQKLNKRRKHTKKTIESLGKLKIKNFIYNN